MSINEIRTTALAWLCEPNANVKSVGVIAFKNQFDAQLNIQLNAQFNLHYQITCPAGRIDTGSQSIENRSTLNIKPKSAVPGIPSQPILVAPAQLPKRSKIGRAHV